MFSAILAAAATQPDGWDDRVLDYLGLVGAILGALLAATAVVAGLRGVYRRTFGRRRGWYQRLGRLGTNAQLAFFASVLGEPPAMRRSFVSNVTRFEQDGLVRMRVPQTFVEAVWIDRDFYLHAIADTDETVHAYSVTTRSKRFHPAFRVPGGTADAPTPLDRLRRRSYHFKPNSLVSLGKTRFAELDEPQQAASWVGAHNAHYFEANYFGNPGLYQHYVFSINDAGAWAWEAGFGEQFMHNFSWGFGAEILDPNLALTQAAIRADAADGEPSALEAENSDEFTDAPDDPEPPAPWIEFRRGARVNTYTIIGYGLALDDYPLAGDSLDAPPTAFGVNYHRVRTIVET